MIFGVVISAALTFFVHRSFPAVREGESFLVRNLPLLAGYFALLLKEIIKAALSVASVSLRPRPGVDPCIVEFHSRLPSDVQNVILANSITLTPGTYTLFQKGDYFVVHCLLPSYGEGFEDSPFVRVLGKMK